MNQTKQQIFDLIEARPPWVGVGITAVDLFTVLPGSIPNLRKSVLCLWARQHNNESPNDTMIRIKRKRMHIGLSNETMRPIDVMLYGMGAILPPRNEWATRTVGTTMVDVWWKTGGRSPMGVVIACGVAHFVHLDEDFDEMKASEWFAWIRDNLRIPVVSHSILMICRNTSEAMNSTTVSRLGANGSRGACMLWHINSIAGRQAVDIVRADIADYRCLLRPIASQIEIAQAGDCEAKSRFSNKAIRAILPFWNWLQVIQRPITPVEKEAQKELSKAPTNGQERDKNATKKAFGLVEEGTQSISSQSQYESAGLQAQLKQAQMGGSEQLNACTKDQIASLQDIGCSS